MSVVPSSLAPSPLADRAAALLFYVALVISRVVGLTISRHRPEGS